MAGRAFLMIFRLINFTIKSAAGIKILTFLDYLYEVILCDSHYVFPALAPGVSVPDFALADAISKWPEMSFFRIAETPQI